MRNERPYPLVPAAKPLLIVFSGLSGVGKDSVLNGLKKSDLALEFIVTLTTRVKRPNEKDGEPYTFVSESKFQELVKGNGLLEWAEVYGNWYGAPKEPVKKALEKGKDVIIKVDVQGAATYKKIVPGAVFIFLAAPSLEELAVRLKGRHTESQKDIDLRLKTAEKEMEQLPLFDYVIFNRPDELDRAVADVKAIIMAEKCRVKPRNIQF